MVTVLSAGAMPRMVKPSTRPSSRQVARDAGQTHGDFAGAHVGQVAERIHGDDVLHVVRVALRGDRGGTALRVRR